jgi:hypothetical protein
VKHGVAILFLLVLSVPSPQTVRDTTPAVSPTSIATASVDGVVKTADAASRPLSGVIVTMSGAGLPAGHSAITDGNGRFSIGGLPAGRFTLTATKAAYLPAAYGSTRPGRAGIEIVLADRQHVAGLTMAISHGAAVSGTVRDPSGQPLATAQVTIQRVGPTGPTTVARTSSDDLGHYRVFGLAPGSYVVSAIGWTVAETVAGNMSTAQVDATLEALRRGRAAGSVAPVVAALPSPPTVNMAPTYYPDASNAAQALPIRLAAGDDHDGADIAVQFLRTGSVAGTVLSPAGFTGAVTLALVGRDAATAPARLTTVVSSTRASVDGSFRFPTVNPGSYLVEARTAAPVGGSGPAPARLWGEFPVDVTGDDLSGLMVVLRQPLHLTGRVVWDDAMGPALDFSQVHVAPTTDSTGRTLGNGAMGMVPSAMLSAIPPVAADGTFSYEITPDAFLVLATGPPGWVVRSAIAAGQDLLDTPLAVPTEAAAVPSVTVTLTRRHTSLIGTVRTGPGQNPSAYFIVVFPTDKALQHGGQRRVRSTRAGTDGTYAFRDLPPGDYLMVAVTDLEPDDMFDPTFFDALAASAISVSLAEGQERTQDLKIGG